MFFSVNGCRHHWIIFSFVPMLKILACWLLIPKSKNTQLAAKPRDHLWVVVAKKHPQVSAHSVEEVSLFWCCFGTSLWRLWHLLAGPFCSQLRGTDVTSASLKYKLTLVQVTHHVRAPQETGCSISSGMFVCSAYFPDVCEICFWGIWRQQHHHMAFAWSVYVGGGRLCRCACFMEKMCPSWKFRKITHRLFCLLVLARQINVNVRQTWRRKIIKYSSVQSSWWKLFRPLHT